MILLLWSDLINNFIYIKFMLIELIIIELEILFHIINDWNKGNFNSQIQYYNWIFFLVFISVLMIGIITMDGIGVGGIQIVDGIKVSFNFEFDKYALL